MQIYEIEKALPNGLHDAGLLNISIDYIGKKVLLDLDINVDDPDNKTSNIYRRGYLELSNMNYCAIEPPDPNYDYTTNKLTIDVGDIDSLATPVKMDLPKQMPKDFFSIWVFVQQWNSFVYIAAEKANFFWRE